MGEERTKEEKVEGEEEQEAFVSSSNLKRTDSKSNIQICCRGCRTTKQKVQRFRWRYDNNINNNGHCNKPENNNRKPEDHPTIIIEQPKQYNRPIQKYNQQRQNLR